MPTVYMPKTGGNYRGKYVDGMGVRRQITFSTNREDSQRELDALKQRGRQESRAIRGGRLAPSDVTPVRKPTRLIEPIMETYIAQMYGGAKYKRDTRNSLLRIFNKCKIETVDDYIGSAPNFQDMLESLLRTDVNAEVGEPGAGKAPSTIAALGIVYAMFDKWLTKPNTAYFDWRYAPSQQIRMPRKRDEDARQPHRGLFVRELMHMKAGIRNGDPRVTERVICDREKRWLMIATRCLTGLRGSELGKLTRGSIDFDTCLLSIRMRHSKIRKFDVVLPISKWLCYQLRDRFDGLGPDELLWPKSLDPKTLQRDLDRAGLAGEGDERIDSRSFRMTFTSWAHLAKLPVKEIAMIRRDFSSSSSKLILKTYMDKKMRLRVLRPAMAKLDKWFRAELAKIK